MRVLLAALLVACGGGEMNKVLRPSARFDTDAGRRTDMLRMIGGLDKRYGQAPPELGVGGSSTGPAPTTGVAASTFNSAANDMFFMRAKGIDRDFIMSGYTAVYVDLGAVVAKRVLFGLYREKFNAAGDYTATLITESVATLSTSGGAFAGDTIGFNVKLPSPIIIKRTESYFIAVAFDTVDAAYVVNVASPGTGFVTRFPIGTGVALPSNVTMEGDVLKPAYTNTGVFAAAADYAPLVILNNAFRDGPAAAGGLPQFGTNKYIY